MPNDQSKLNAFIDPKADDQLYYVTSYPEAINVLTPNSGVTTTLVSSNPREYIVGIAYDTKRNKLYWSTYDAIKRCDASDGSNVETVLRSACKLIV